MASCSLLKYKTMCDLHCASVRAPIVVQTVCSYCETCKNAFWGQRMRGTRTGRNSEHNIVECSTARRKVCRAPHSLQNVCFHKFDEPVYVVGPSSGRGVNCACLRHTYTSSSSRRTAPHSLCRALPSTARSHAHCLCGAIDREITSQTAKQNRMVKTSAEKERHDE